MFTCEPLLAPPDESIVPAASPFAPLEHAVTSLKPFSARVSQA